MPLPNTCGKQNMVVRHLFRRSNLSFGRWTVKQLNYLHNTSHLIAKQLLHRQFLFLNLSFFSSFFSQASGFKKNIQTLYMELGHLNKLLLMNDKLVDFFLIENFI